MHRFISAPLPLVGGSRLQTLECRDGDLKIRPDAQCQQLQGRTESKRTKPSDQSLLHYIRTLSACGASKLPENNQQKNEKPLQSANLSVLVIDQYDFGLELAGLLDRYVSM